MASPKPKGASLLGWPKRHKIFSLLIIMVLVVAGYFAYEAYAGWQNKRDFQQARSAIDTIYTDIVARVGQPDNSKTTNTCSRRYQEFTGYGDTTCHVDASFIYGVPDETSADVLFRKAQRAIATHDDSFKITRPLSRSLINTLVVNSYYHVASDEYESHGLKCVVNYVYDTPREIDLAIKDVSKKPFEITIGCYGPARGQYYLLAY